MDPNDPPQRHSFSQTMANLLRRTGVSKSSVIRVVGPGGLAALLWLCRRGYQQVGYVRQGPCPSEDCDLLLVLHSGERDLAAALDRGPHLRAGGVLVVETPDPVDGFLNQRGYAVEGRLPCRDSELHLARREVDVRKAA